MRPTLTAASSLTPYVTWWRNVSMPAPMLPGTLSRVILEIARLEPSSGVAVTIRSGNAREIRDETPSDEGTLLPPDKHASIQS